MVYRAMTLVKEEFANDPRIRSWSFTKSRCQTGSWTLKAVACYAVGVDWRQGLAAMWLLLAIIGPSPWCAGTRIRRPCAA